MSRSRMYAQHLRRIVFERDKGVCAHCEADCEKVKRVFWAILDFDAQQWYSKHLGINDHGRTFWDADHIQEVAENGSDALRNLQTLCVACHREKTREWQRNRQRGNPVVALVLRQPEYIAPPLPTIADIVENNWDHPYYRHDRVQLVIDYVNRYIAGQIADRGDWPQTLRPIESDYLADPMIYH